MSRLRLAVSSMTCRTCVREVSAWVRDVAGVQTVSADARTGTLEVAGTMALADVLAVFADSKYMPQVLEGPTDATAWPTRRDG